MLTFGTDPEYFITEMIDGKEFGVPVPHFLSNLGVPEIGYDETRKHPVLAKEENFKIIMDGIAAEFTVPPVKTAIDMYREIQDGLNWLGNFSSQFGYEVSVKPTVHYDFFKWYNPDDQALAWCGVFGCDPDRDAIITDYHSPEIDVTTHPYRYGGGHFHISDDMETIYKYPVPYIRLLAITCGNFSIAKSPYKELEELRMFKYGQPGRYRIQEYPDTRFADGKNIGVEYRSPSNIWTTDLGMIEGMMYWANRAYELLNNQERAVNCIETYLAETVSAIQTVDQDKADWILSKI